MNKYLKVIIFNLAIIVIGASIYYFIVNRPGNAPVQTPSTASETLLQTQTNSEGAVVVKAIPKTLTAGSPATFELIFDTHSVELNYDVAKIARLTDDTGNTYDPVFWTGGKGGHHIEGILTFPDIPKGTKKITLTIPGIDNRDRVFSWNLN